MASAVFQTCYSFRDNQFEECDPVFIINFVKLACKFYQASATEGGAVLINYRTSALGRAAILQSV